MKQYLLFSGDTYYPYGGWRDFDESFDSIDEAEKYISNNHAPDWWQIVDIKTGKIVKSNNV